MGLWRLLVSAVLAERGFSEFPLLWSDAQAFTSWTTELASAWTQVRHAEPRRCKEVGGVLVGRRGLNEPPHQPAGLQSPVRGERAIRMLVAHPPRLSLRCIPQPLTLRRGWEETRASHATPPPHSRDMAPHCGSHATKDRLRLGFGRHVAEANRGLPRPLSISHSSRPL